MMRDNCPVFSRAAVTRSALVCNLELNFDVIVTITQDKNGIRLKIQYYKTRKFGDMILLGIVRDRNFQDETS